ncbi:restriction endonuclease subunit S [Thiolapillus sp.]|uniref:restriction endonuclease subunit S n=1 Tax=Thiolapillus sp. TaxID=2017437 RepID=UPI0025F3E991|nr:restriction endonuclease subunit S [Thiolapillus sp.]
MPKNTVLLTTRAPIGYVALSANPIATNQGFRSLIVKPEFDHEFLYYWLKVNKTKLERHASGSTFKELSGTALKNIAIRLPTSKAEQRAIAHILGSLDDKIELNRQMAQTLESIARAIFKSWFVDFDPVKAKMEGKQPEGMTEEIAALFPDRLVDSELGMIPEGWEYKALGDMINIFDSKRIPLSRSQRKARQGKYPYYGATSIMDYVDDYIFDGVYVLIGEDGSVKKPDGTPFLQYVSGKIWVNNHAHVIQGKRLVTSAASHGERSEGW